MLLEGLERPERALERVLNTLDPPVERRCMDVQETINHVLAENVVALRGVPPWSRAGLDGYAVRSNETPGVLRVARLPITRSPAEEPPELPGGSASYVPTGAYLPRGADSLVPIELVEELEDGLIRVPEARRGRNVDEAGSLLPSGGTVLDSGTLLTPARVAGLADVGVERVCVWERLRVAVGVLGAGGGVRDTSGPLLEWLLSKTPWVSLVSRRIVGRSGGGVLEDVVGGENVHVVFLVGRVGPGKDDFYESLVDDSSARTVVRGVALKGSRPFTVLEWKGIPVVWLPGMPTSLMTSFLLLVLPLLETWGRVGRVWRKDVFRWVRVRGWEALRGRRLGYALLGEGGLEARVLEAGLQRSGSVVSLALADGVVFLDVWREDWGGGAWFLPLGG